MNDIEKLSPDMKKALAVRAKQESASKARKSINERRALIEGVSVGELNVHSPLEPMNTLPDNGDGQNTLLPRSQLTTGLIVKILPWDDMGDEGANFAIRISFDDPTMPGDDSVIVEPDFDPFDFTVDISSVMFDHGAHTLYWWSRGVSTGNTLEGPPLDFFIDIENPNFGQQPDEILLPQDLPGGVITQDYLDQNGGVTFTLPPFADPRLGDKFSFFINDQEILEDQDAVVPVEIFVDKAVFVSIPEGTITLTYNIIDRAGNRTDLSLPETVTLVKTPAPDAIRAPIIPEGPVISRMDALDGVTVLHDYDTPTNDDFISFYWQDLPQDSYVPPTSSVDVPFKDIASLGDTYQATVYYAINRNGTLYNSPSVTVDVDLTYIGPDPDPEDPDIVNPDLDPLTLVSSTGEDNAIVPADKGQDATITVKLYTPVNAGEIIEVFYGNAGNSVEAVTLDAADITAGEIDVTLPWAMIDAQGNGTIDAFYQIYAAGKPENAQQSPTTQIVVTVNNLQDLPLLEFSNREVDLNIINCNVKPWENGVDITMVYPFEAGDALVIHWVLDNTWLPPDHTDLPNDPLEASRRDFEHAVTPAEASIGKVVYNIVWGDHLNMLTEGSIVAGWSLKRGEVSGSSQLQFVRYNRHRPGSGRPVCPDDDPV